MAERPKNKKTGRQLVPHRSFFPIGNALENTRYRRYASSLVSAEYVQVRLLPRDSQALISGVFQGIRKKIMDSVRLRSGASP